MLRLLNKFGETWCRLMHPDPMWPVNGTYRCRKCLREFPVAWEQDLRKPRPAFLPAQPAPAPVTVLRPAGRQAA
jgi:hypothetical protein